MANRDLSRSLIPWSFFRDLEEPESLFYRPILPLLEPFSFGDDRWGPALEISEHDDKYTIKAELPGMKQEDVEVSVLDHTLSIKGEKKHKEEVKKDGYHYSEVSYGTFNRSVTLPADVTTDKIEASYEDGMLIVNVPRAPESKPKKVTIESKKKEQTAKA